MPIEPWPPVPDAVLDASRKAFDLHDPRLAVAGLVADSLLDADVAPADGANRRLHFEREGVCIDVDLWTAPGGSRVRIRVDHERGCRSAELVQPNARTTLAMAAGTGEFGDVAEGLTTVVLSGCAGDLPPSLRTAWFTI
jgi:hypothetical protein